ncbi:MAG: hypothetical protein MUP40_07330 [Actinobacteria bacterium]|nr:hypothetical protein [Actinomycetota bacterium]MDP2953653.1 hypothetical protein [Chloroflexota bacterium]
MALIRGFAQIDDGGRIPLPHSVYVHLGLAGKKGLRVDVVSTGGGTRSNRLLVHPADYSSKISPLQSVVASGVARVDEEGAIIPEEKILSLVGFAPGDHLEMKMQGTAGQPCLAVYHRTSPVRLSREGTIRHRGKSVKVMKYRY